MEERPAGQAEEDDRRTDETEDRVDLAPPLELGGVFRGRRGVHLVECGRQRTVEVRAAKPRKHVFIEDRLTFLVGQEGGLEPGAGIQLDLAVSRFGSMSKKMTRPSSNPLRPTPHWSMRARAFVSVSPVVG